MFIIGLSTGFWGLWFFHALAVLDIAWESNRDSDVVTCWASCEITCSPAVTFQLWGRNSTTAPQHKVASIQTGSGRWPLYSASLLFIYFLISLVSTDACSDVRQLFKGRLRMKSNFCMVIMIESSEFIGVVNINYITQKCFLMLTWIFCQ